MEDYETFLKGFDYVLPHALIASEPANPRDSARLLVYDRKHEKLTFDVFRNLPDYLPKDSVVVFNRTKVIPAKMTLKKNTGGKVSVLFLETVGKNIHVLASGQLKAGDVLKWHTDYSFEVAERSGQQALLTPLFSFENFEILLQQLGETPLPPYMKNSPLSEARRRKEYQTVFAKEEGSLAAPTAGLHFSEDLIKKIEHSGRDIAEVTLHVGLGTFAPLTEKNILEKRLHRELYSIDRETAQRLSKAKKDGRPIVAVGTTTVRTLESASVETEIVRREGHTELFMMERDQPHFVDHLITNFHVPRSSLFMLVSAFVGRKKLLELYEKAIEEKMRFFSFGDAMLII